jgi:predicted nucleic acid-binding protein
MERRFGQMTAPGRHHLDANIVLRFLRDDDRKQSPAAARLFAAAKSGKIRLAMSAVTVAEIFYVLARAYQHSKPDAAAKLLPLVQSDLIEIGDRAIIIDALQRVVRANVDFGDGYLAAAAAAAGDTVASFDRDLGSFSDVTVVVPA